MILSGIVTSGSILLSPSMATLIHIIFVEICFLCPIILVLKQAKAKRIAKHFNDGDYDYVIRNEKYLRKAKNEYQKSDNLIMLAVAYFEKHDDASFLICVNEISHPDFINKKIHLQALHAIVTQNGYFPMLRNTLCNSPFKNEKGASITNLDCITQLCSNPDCRIEDYPAFKKAFDIRTSERVIRFISQCRSNMKEGL